MLRPALWGKWSEGPAGGAVVGSTMWDLEGWGQFVSFDLEHLEIVKAEKLGRHPWRQ